MKNFSLGLLFILILSTCSSPNKLGRKVATLPRHDMDISAEKPRKRSLAKIQLFYVRPKTFDLSLILTNDLLLSSPYYTHIVDDLQKLYTIRKYKPLWLQYINKPKPVYHEAVRQMLSGKEHGLEPEAYCPIKLREQIKSLESRNLSGEEMALLDMNITGNYLLFNYHIIKGRINPEKLSLDWFKDEKKLELAKRLSKISTSKGLRSHFNQILPKNHNYKQLRKFLAFYRNVAGQGGWDQLHLKDDQLIEPGISHSLIPLIRKRLAFTDPVKKLSNRDSLLYDTRLQSVVKRFQHRHGLEVDGIIGKETIKALNISPEEKVEMIKLNLERIRWLPRNYGSQYVIVNIPEFYLRIYQNSKLKLKMRVIVGKEYTSTPVFSDTLQYLVFSPTWTVPNSIKSEEMLPRLQRDSAYYSDRNYKFYRGWSKTDEIDPKLIDWSAYSLDHFPFNVVQQPGPTNALGLVKFIMPNNLSIYLHDTPTDHLFDRHERAFSHGCIRVEKPALLAAYFLRDQKQWTTPLIIEHMYKEEPVQVDFTKGYHLQITYLTAFVDEFGLMNFREDIYGHDMIQMRRLAARLEMRWN